MKKIALLLALAITTLFNAQENTFVGSENHQSMAERMNSGDVYASINLQKRKTAADYLPIHKDSVYRLNLEPLELSPSKSTSPYEWNWVCDGIWTGVGLGASALGLSLIQNKEDLPIGERDKFLNEESLQKEIDNLNFLDRWVAGNHSESANSFSDVPFAASFVVPFVFLFDDEINDHTGLYLGMYLESLATTAGMYTITAGLVNRSRPYVYDNSGDTSSDRRFNNNGQRAFYSGHVAATATATFYAVKVFCDYNPDAKGKAFMWAGAAALPASVGIFRMEAGQHFLTDVLLGYVLGAGTGILVPELHKMKNDNFQIYPSSGRSFNGDEYKGMALSLTF